MKKQKIFITLPVVIAYDDYHQIKETAQTLSVLTGVKVKGKEITDSNEFNGFYFGVYYTDKLPTKDEVKELKKHIIHL